MDGYSPEDRARGQRLMVVEGIFSRAMDSFTGGVVLAALALALGASDLEIGLIAAIPFLAQLAHIPALALLARWRDRRPLTVLAAAGARLLLIAMGVLAVVAVPGPPVAVLLALLLAYAVLATLSAAAWQVWMRDLVPPSELGAYHGRRFAVLASIGFVGLLVAGQVLAWWRATGPGGPGGGFAALYAAGAILGLVSCAVMSRAPTRPHTTSIPAGFRASLARPFRSKNYRRVLTFLATWGFAANLALPFLSIVLLRTLGYGLGVVTALAAASAAANFLGFRLWAPLADRFGAKPILGLNAAVFVLAMLGWAVLPKAGANILPAAVLIHLLLGFSTSGLDLGSTTLVMKLAPQDEAAAYLASASVVKAVATGIAPLLGGIAATLLVDRSFTVSFAWASPAGVDVVNAVSFAHLDFLFLASGILGLYAVHRLLGFEEPGEAPAEEVVRAMRRDMGSLSSVAGMRQFAHVASYVVEVAHRVEKNLPGPRAPGRE